MKKILKIAVIMLILAGGSFSCGEENNYDDGIIPCDSAQRNKKIMKLKNLETKLYFSTSFIGHAPAEPFMPDNGIGYKENGVLNCTNSKGIKVQCSICNFPDYAIKWNLKNIEDKSIGDSVIECIIDVIISGKVYIDSESEETIVGTLELTSLKRKES